MAGSWRLCTIAAIGLLFGAYQSVSGQTFTCSRYVDTSSHTGFCLEVACLGYCLSTPLPAYCMQKNYVDKNICKDVGPPAPTHCQQFSGKQKKHHFWCQTTGCRHSFYSCLKSGHSDCSGSLAKWAPKSITKYCSISSSDTPSNALVQVKSSAHSFHKAALRHSASEKLPPFLRNRAHHAAATT